MKVTTNRGTIDISNDVFSDLTGCAAANCFGVKGMAVRSMKDGLVHLLRGEHMAKGVRASFDEDGGLRLEVHIIVDHGVNIAVLCKSIISEVNYNVSRLTGVQVKSVNVFVDGIE